MSASREELIGLVDRYLDALAAHDPSRLPLARNVKFTENCSTLGLGKGLWATCSGRGRYRHYVAEPAAGQVGFFGTVEENGAPAILALRLKAEGPSTLRHSSGQTGSGRAVISEVETLVARQGNPLFAPENLTEPLPLFGEIVPPTERSSREELVRITDLYFDAIERNDGSIIPVTKECIRLENGVHTANNPQSPRPTGRMSVADAISTGIYTYIPEIRDRRYPVVDVERGLCWGIVFFEHPGNVRSIELRGIGRVEMAPFTQRPSSAMIAELFKIRAGQIQIIEAVLEFLPYGIRSGWD